MGGLKFIIVHRLEASPAVVRLLERIATGGPPPEVTEALARIEESMATTRELLDALRVGVERNEAFAADIAAKGAEIKRLQDEKAQMVADEEIEDREELAEDEAEAERVRQHEAERLAWDQERTTLQERVAFLEAQPKISEAERDELAELIERLNKGGPTGTDDGEAPPAPEVPPASGTIRRTK
jgi:outer membrane protein OmpA-like peptidoglycan-associated protein